ncbi:aromatic ring-hydroxylating oxygenase subunit alpha [Amycolatopsis vastitatis]|uniref:Rieske domain-containing protein n=1 Tax=Amycolatopsis vastitatis TaxID=1905142 RepID=A0A229SKQ6_9PSEU|nr:aromatic ring-hydroxylating dioxygenase subunit alpha [Amycolatopsis vastitatis]OXM59360.1 hypothetical protein CF165_48175 [Amycolatopsis vastitatis]
MTTSDIGALIAAAGDHVRHDRTLPAEMYTSAEFFATESRWVFQKSWVPVCRVPDLLAAGAGYTPKVVCGVEVVVTVDEGQRIRVFLNVCRHRGMLLADRPQQGKKLVCGYHRWSYRLDGEPAGLPLVSREVDRARCRLHPVRHETWQGWLFVNLAGDARSLTDEISGLHEVVDDVGLPTMLTAASREFVSTWNWKVMWENYNEFYHHLGTHRDTLEPLLPAATASTLDNHGEAWSCTTVPCTEQYLSMQPLTDHRRTPDMALFSVFPLLCAGWQPGSAFWMEIIPEDVVRHKVVWHLLVPPERMDDPKLETEITRVMDGLGAIHDEDMKSCTLVQRGLSSALNTSGNLTELDKPISQMHRWLVGLLEHLSKDDPSCGGSGRQRSA